MEVLGDPRDVIFLFLHNKTVEDFIPSTVFASYIE